MKTAIRRTVLLSTLVLPLGGVAGCGSGNEPRLVEVPEFKAAPDTSPPKIPGRKIEYGASPKYQEAYNK